MTTFDQGYLTNEPIDESALLSVEYIPSSEQMILVYDYVAQAISDHFETVMSVNPDDKPKIPLRDFRKITFSGVLGYWIFDGNKYCNLRPDALQQRINCKPTIIVGARLSENKEQGFLSAKIFLTDKLFLELRYLNSSIEQKTAYGIYENSDWVYYDSKKQ